MVPARPLLGILLLAALLRVTLFVAIAHHPDRFYTNDSVTFVRIATDLSDVYAAESGRLFRLGLIRTPGYPLLVAAGFSLTGNAPWSIVLFQIAVGVLTVWLVYRLAFRLLGPRAALWSALALAVDPISIILANHLQPEIIFTFLLVAGTLLWVRGLQERALWYGVGAGLLLGAATLVRPIGLYLPIVVLAVSLLLCRGRWIQRLVFTMVLVLAFAIPVGGWIARNALVSGVPLLTTGDGNSLLHFRAALVLAEAEGLPLKEAQDQLKAALKQRQQPGMNAAEVSRLERSMAIEVLLDHPLASLEAVTKGVVLTMIGPGRAELLHLMGDPTPTRISGLVQILLITVEIVVYGIILISAVVGCYVLLRTRKYFAAVILLSIIMYFILATVIGSTGYSRYRVPIMPFIAVFAGYGFAYWERHQSRVGQTEQEPRPAHG